jgi:uncharacterized membrane-anchored protein
MVNLSTQQISTTPDAPSSIALTWVQAHGKKILLGAMTLQLLVLSYMVYKPVRTLLTGDSFLVHVVPVDPRDLFRGDYVILSYEMSRAPDSLFGEDRYENYGKPVYVTLEKDEDGKHWKAANYSFEKPNDQKFIRGVFNNWRQITYGIESYYLQEGTGKAYEDAVRSKKLSAEITIDETGQAYLKRLIIDP